MADRRFGGVKDTLPRWRRLYASKNRTLRRFLALRALLTALLLISSACVYHVTRGPLPSPEPRTAPEPPASSPLLAFSPVEPLASAHESWTSGAMVEVLGLQFPSVGENGQEGNRVTVKYYRSRLPGPKPLLVILPIWGSSTYPPRKMVRHVLRRSDGEMDVIWIQGVNRIIDWEALASAPDEQSFLAGWRRMGARERATIVDILRILDWGARQQETDPRRIGLMGFSHGAMVAAFIATQDPRLAATVLVMGGAHPYEALAECPGGWTEKLRQAAERRFGWSAQDYEGHLASIYGAFDPANYPGRVDPTRILIFDAASDSCVPPNAREALWESLGYPERVTFAYGHKTSFLSMTPLGFNWTRRKIWAFLDDTLVERPLPEGSVEGQARLGQGANAGSPEGCPQAEPN